MSKRNSAGNVTSTLGLECLPLSRTQLRDLWNYDNECGSQFMGAPLRICSSMEDDTAVEGHNSGIPCAELKNLKQTIKEMWVRAGTLFEVFYDAQRPDLGYRLKVKDSLPIKVTLKEDDMFYFGWCAVAPEDSLCTHLYKRSPLQPCGYLGGPASLCNWVLDKQATVSFSRPLRKIARYLLRLQCRNLSKGQELLSNYGNTKIMATEADWFLKGCCNVFKEADRHVKRQDKRKNLSDLMFVECCVLCGKQYSIKNKECRIQRKPHFVNSHADFLGSKWNGLGPYMQEEVDATAVLAEADKLNCLIQTLTKDLKWSIVPACNVIGTNDKDEYDNPEALLTEFRRRCTLLKGAGTLVLRGAAMDKMINELSVDHLRPVPVSVWRTLNWKNKVQPPFGVYSVPNEMNDDHTIEVQSAITKFCLFLN
ncbi:uncharacterized protein LOC117652955 [Thrips palmi]|uniref:Uncharacterized protein LOC117652955 n=1 Tax=Thrips palmi TaxID=161013 RepID=A0A6P9A9U1_THRPL|nr:uncharacterized protein LOC117652955 [Thrips palmi]